jgi:hypothetical protein
MSDDRTASLRALIQDRKSKDIRRTYTHTFCLQPDLVREYRELESEAEELEKELRRLSPDDEDTKPANGRMAGGPRMTLEKAIKAKQAELDAKQAEILAVAVKIRFKTVKDGRFPEMVDDWDTREAKSNVRFKETLLETFDRFVDPEDMTREDFIDDLAVFDEGEYFAAASEITTLMNSTVNVPKFVKPSSARRR